MPSTSPRPMLSERSLTSTVSALHTATPSMTKRDDSGIAGVLWAASSGPQDDPAVVEMDGQKRSARVASEDLRGQLDRPGAADDRVALPPRPSAPIAPYSIASERGSASETARSWVTTMTVAPLSSRASRSAAITMSRLWGSSWPVGSSASSTRGESRQRTGDRRSVLLSGRESVHGPVGELSQTHALHQISSLDQRSGQPRRSAPREAKLTFWLTVA